MSIRLLCFVHVWRCVCAYRSANPESDFPAALLPENPAKKWKNRLTRQLKALILGEHALGEDFLLMCGNCCKTADLS